MALSFSQDTPIGRDLGRGCPFIVEKRGYWSSLSRSWVVQQFSIPSQVLLAEPLVLVKQRKRGHNQGSEEHPGYHGR